jgi:plasmid replication initiation protein
MKLPIKRPSRTIKKSNELNQSSFTDYGLNDYRIALLAIQKASHMARVEQLDLFGRTITLRADELAKMFGIDKDNAYGALNSVVAKLFKTAITIKPREGDKFSKKVVALCESAEYFDGEGRIELTFTQSILPHLSNLENKFTIYNLRDVAKFGSLYSLRLYEQVLQHKMSGWFVFDVATFKAIMGIQPTQYKQTGDVINLVITPAIAEIYKVHRLKISLEKIKTGKKVTSLKFKFKPFEERWTAGDNPQKLLVAPRD